MPAYLLNHTILKILNEPAHEIMALFILRKFIIQTRMHNHPVGLDISSRKLLRIKLTPDLHLAYSKNGGNLGLVLKKKNIACLSILLTKHEKYSYLYLFKFVLYGNVPFKAN